LGDHLEGHAALIGLLRPVGRRMEHIPGLADDVLAFDTAEPLAH